MTRKFSFFGTFRGNELRAQTTIDELEAVQASRVLTDVESCLLERSLRRLGPKRDIWRWSAKDDRRLKLLIKKRGQSLRTKPFQRNDEVQRIAKDMGRSYLAVLKRIERLRQKYGLAKQPLVYGSSSVRREYKCKDAPDLSGMVSPADALLILQKRCPRMSERVLKRWRTKGGGPPFITLRGSADWCRVWYSEKGLAKFPVEQIMAEAESRQRGWLIHTAMMDPEYECPNASNGRKG